MAAFEDPLAALLDSDSDDDDDGGGAAAAKPKGPGKGKGKRKKKWTRTAYKYSGGKKGMLEDACKTYVAEVERADFNGNDGSGVHIHWKGWRTMKKLSKAKGVVVERRIGWCPFSAKSSGAQCTKRYQMTRCNYAD